MRPELVVAGKEFRDHVTSKRFLIIFAILMLLAIYSMVNGLNQYNQTLEDYKKNQQSIQQQDWFKQEVSDLQQQIRDAQAKNNTDLVQTLENQLNSLVNPTMPSMLYVFGNMNQYFVLIGMVLSVAIGFDLITKEREEGSLKSLLSHPIYRDAVINGKALGALAVLTVSIGAMMLVMIAIMLFYGIVPDMDDTLRIIAYFVLALVYCAIFFGLALMTSTIAKSSAMSVLYVMAIVIAMVIIPMFSGDVANLVMGQAPQAPDTGNGGPILFNKMVVPVNSTGGMDTPTPTEDPRWTAYNNAVQDYYNRYNMITSSLNGISPINNFQYNIANAILYDTGSGGVIMPMEASSASPMRPAYSTEKTVWDSLAYVWNNLLAMLVELILPLAISYVLFMRSDIR